MKWKILLLTCANCTVLSPKSRMPSPGFSTSDIKTSNSDGEETAASFMFTSLWHDISLPGGKYNDGTAPYFERKAPFLF